jgi:hypothetical protein
MLIAKISPSMRSLRIAISKVGNSSTGLQLTVFSTTMPIDKV